MVRRCIEQLPAIYRSVLQLRDIEELDTKETVQVLRVTANTVKVRLHRARQALKALIERDPLFRSIYSVPCSPQNMSTAFALAGSDGQQNREQQALKCKT
jgi:hypothetical protein